MNNMELFESSHEQDYLRRELGDVVSQPDVAITELVANAHDAGASSIKIVVPNNYNALMSFEDNGTGMTKDHIQNRWMKLRYNRLDRQGPNVDFPAERKGLKRKAYGRNGIGRHALFCFSDSYKLETWKDGIEHSLEIAIGSDKPLVVKSHKERKRKGHGTRLTVQVQKNLWSANKIKEMLSLRFISMPDFSIEVNGQKVDISNHPNIVDKKELEVGDIKLNVVIIDAKAASRSLKYNGIGIWVGGRRVGEMEWRVGSHSFIDGRKSFSLRFAIIVQTDDLRDEILEDWSGFKPKSTAINSVAEALYTYINEKRRELLKDEIAEIKSEALEANRKELEELPQLAKEEISDFAEEILNENPDIKPDIMQLAIKAAINLEKSHFGQSLLAKLTTIAVDDIEALNKLLDEWTAKDALKVLSEIDSRIKVIETLRRLSGDKDADELHTIHPLMLKARWLFGPEYESSEYSSNVGLVKTIQKVFGKKIDKEAFINSQKRPDITILKDSSIGAQALEEPDEDGIVKVKTVLVIEVKKGGLSIGRDEVGQADGYVQDIVYSDILASSPFVNAIVVGETIESKTSTKREIMDDNGKVIGKVVAVTFSNLIATAEGRLFRLRDKLKDHYDSISTEKLKAETLTTNIKLDM